MPTTDPAPLHGRRPRRRPSRPALRPMNYRLREDHYELGMEAAPATGQSFPDVHRAFVAWWLRQPGARLPARPSPDDLAAAEAALTEQAS